MNNITTPEHQAAANRVRELLAKYDEVELLVKIGEYQEGADPVADEALSKYDDIVAFLKQRTDEQSEFDETIEQLQALV